MCVINKRLKYELFNYVKSIVSFSSLRVDDDANYPAKSKVDTPHTPPSPPPPPPLTHLISFGPSRYSSYQMHTSPLIRSRRSKESDRGAASRVEYKNKKIKKKKEQNGKEKNANVIYESSLILKS